MKKNPKTSLRKAAEEVKSKTGKDISYVTIKRILNEKRIFAFSPIKKPLLSKKNIALRKKLSEKIIFHSEEEIKQIIFSDESKFNLFYSDGRLKVWREPSIGLKSKNLMPTIKFGEVQ